MYSLNHSFFSPTRLADKRAPEPPSCQSPLPEALSPPLDSTPASGLTSLLFRKRCSISHNASSFPDYREIHQFSQAVSFAIRSTPKMQQHVSALSASPRQGVQRESVRLGPNVSHSTHCHDGVVSPGTKHRTTWRERASNLSVPLILVMAPCNQELKRRYAPLNNASHQKGRLYLRQGWSPEARNGASGSGDWQEGGSGAILSASRVGEKNK